MEGIYFFMKNLLIKFLISLCRFFRKKKPIASDDRRYLIVSTTGLGDTLWASPAIKALRQSYPNAYIAVLTSPVGKEVLRHSPHLNDIFVFTPSFRLLSLLKKKQLTTLLVFHTSQRAALPFCFFTGAREIIGTHGINKGLDFILTTALEPTYVHEVVRRLEIVAQVGAKTSDPSLEMHIDEQDNAQASSFLNKHAIPSYLPIIGIHPGAKDRFKQWDPECFIDVGNRLVQYTGCRIIVTGNPSENALMTHIASRIQGAIAMTDSLSIHTFAALVKKFSVMISNDTGPMHIAFAMGTPTVALFTPTDPQLCGPYFAERATVIEKKRTCAPCLRKKCNEPFCLLQISPDEVYQATLNLFYNHKA